jgi:ATP-dependent Clp protease ATP-binding subunit ClpC
MTSGHTGPGDFGRDPLGDFLARFLGAGQPASQRAGGGRSYEFMRLMSEPARQLVSAAAQYAAQHGSADLDTEHLLRAALSDEPTRSMVGHAGADPDLLAADIDRQAGEGPPRTSIALSPAVKRALWDSHDIARARGASYIGPEHILTALAANRDSSAGQMLAGAAHGEGFGGRQPSFPEASAGGGERGAAAGARSPGTPLLERYGRDLTQEAREGRVDPVIGRESEIEQTVEVLARRGKNNPVLIGEAGVGKTAIVEGLAQRIVEGGRPGQPAGPPRGPGGLLRRRGRHALPR